MSSRRLASVGFLWSAIISCQPNVGASACTLAGAARACIVQRAFMRPVLLLLFSAAYICLLSGLWSLRTPVWHLSGSYFQCLITVSDIVLSTYLFGARHQHGFCLFSPFMFGKEPRAASEAMTIMLGIVFQIECCTTDNC